MRGAEDFNLLPIWNNLHAFEIIQIYEKVIQIKTLNLLN